MLEIEEITEEKEIEDVLDNLHFKTEEELFMSFGIAFKDSILKEIKKTKRKYLIKKPDGKNAGLFGVIEYNRNAAGIFLLTKNELEGYKINFLRQAKRVVDTWAKEYKLLFDCCLEENKKIQKWLLLLGFKPSCYIENGFRMYYKGDVKILAELTND